LLLFFLIFKSEIFHLGEKLQRGLKSEFNSTRNRLEANREGGKVRKVRTFSLLENRTDCASH